MVHFLTFYSETDAIKMFGTIVNAVLIIIGGLIGTLCGNKISARYTGPIMTVMGLITACIGIQGAAGTKSFLVEPIISRTMRSCGCSQPFTISMMNARSTLACVERNFTAASVM